MNTCQVQKAGQTGTSRIPFRFYELEPNPGFYCASANHFNERRKEQVNLTTIREIYVNMTENLLLWRYDRESPSAERTNLLPKSRNDASESDERSREIHPSFARGSWKTTP